MKQNISNRLFNVCSHPLVLALLLAGGLASACKKDTAGALPEGQYPVIPTAVVQAIPLGSGTEAWAGEEKIAVQSVSSNNGNETETRVYEAASDGILGSSEPIWWKHSGEKKKVSAWFCGDSSSAKGGVNASALPSVWAVQADQSGEGYDKSRLLYAPAREAVFAPSRIVPLTFYHQPAKIVMNVNESNSVTSANQIQSIKIGDMILSGVWSAPEAAGETVGTWTEDANATKGDILLHKLSKPEGSALATFAGYAVPQDMAGLNVTVTTSSGGSLTAALASDVEPLTAGNAGTFMLTVDSDNLVVEALKLETEFTAEDLKFGDYFYNDGTVSDGGLRGIYTNGSLKMEPNKPAPVAGKQLVGIVFQTSPARIGQAEKDAIGYTEGDAIGLVMSLKNAAADVTWGPQTDEASLTNTGKHSDIYNDISGYANYTALCAAHPEDIDSYPAFKAVMDYNKTCLVPENTTGWFLPSGGQMWDIMQILGACTQLADHQTDAGTGWQIELKGMAGYIDNLNAWMETVVASNKDVFEAGKYILSSTERSNTNAWYWIMNEDVLYLQGGSKTQQFNVRPVLAFKWIDPDEPLDPLRPTDPEEPTE